jgi:hypothetical protein
MFKFIRTGKVASNASKPFQMAEDVDEWPDWYVLNMYSITV